MGRRTHRVVLRCSVVEVNVNPIITVCDVVYVHACKYLKHLFLVFTYSSDMYRLALTLQNIDKHLYFCLLWPFPYNVMYWFSNNVVFNIKRRLNL